MTTKIPPNSKESEMMVLGSMLTSINAMNVAADALDDEDFYYTEHQKTFSVLKDAYKKDRPADMHLVCEELKRRGDLQAVGGAAYVVTLSQYAGTSAHIEEYVRSVREKSILRRMIYASQSIEKAALEEPSDVSASLDEAQSLFYKISQSAQSGHALSIGEILTGTKSESGSPFIKALQERQEDYAKYGKEKRDITGISSGFIDLDKLTDGLGKSNLIIVAARPAMGKTAFAINIAENVCFESNKPVGIFSLEMSADQLVNRIVCSQSEVESEKIKTGSITGDDFQKVVNAVGKMQRYTMIIDDQPGLKVTDLRARARRMKESHGIALLIIDYLQLLSGSGSNRSGENRQAEISEISRMLKNLARELNIPIICLSQLSRKVEERESKRPQMSDLRESGSIEQDADIVAFLLRPEYYDPINKPGMAEIIVSKNRHGGIGSVHLTYRKEIVKFCNYTPVQVSNLHANEYHRFNP